MERAVRWVFDSTTGQNTFDLEILFITYITRLGLKLAFEKISCQRRPAGQQNLVTNKRLRHF